MTVLLPPWQSGLVIAIVFTVGAWLYLRPGARNRPVPLVGLYAALIIAILASFVLGFSVDRWWWLATENGMIEWATFWLQVSAAIVFGTVWWRSRKRRPNLLAFGGMLFAVFVAGEEIAWGQHVFLFEPPPAFAEHNRQGEVTLHNLMIGEQYVGSMSQAFGPIVLFSSILILQRLFPGASRRVAGFDYDARIAGLLTILGVYMIVSAYPFAERVPSPISLAEIPRAIVSRHSGVQSEMSECTFAGAMTVAALALLLRTPRGGGSDGRSKHDVETVGGT